MKHVLTAILITLSNLSSFAQTNTEADLSSYDFDTTLKSGYHISFQTDDSTQYLYLKKGNKTITELSSTSKGLPYQNLGYIGADFTNYFVLVHAYGGGNPHYIELFKKSTGENVLKRGAAIIDADEQQEYLLYSNQDVPGRKDKMTLINMRTGAKQQFPFPAELLAEPEVLNRISIIRLTKKQLMIKYETGRGTKTKTYHR